MSANVTRGYYELSTLGELLIAVVGGKPPRIATVARKKIYDGNEI